MSQNKTTRYMGKFPLGMVVCNKSTGDYGHVTGFTRSVYDDGYEVILRIRWDDGETRDIHPTNVDILD